MALLVHVNLPLSPTNVPCKNTDFLFEENSQREDCDRSKNYPLSFLVRLKNDDSDDSDDDNDDDDDDNNDTKRPGRHRLKSINNRANGLMISNHLDFCHLSIVLLNPETR